MLQGKVQTAFRYLSQHTEGGVPKPDDKMPEPDSDGTIHLRSTVHILLEKHPVGKIVPECTLLNGTPNAVNPILFDSLDADAICQTALHTHRAAGPSGLDAYAWRRMCSSFKAASTDLCSALAAVGQRIYTSTRGLICFCYLSSNSIRQKPWCTSNRDW